YAHAVDILASDDYPINEKKPCNLLRVARTTDLLRRATKGEKPVWLVIQSTSKATPEEEYAVTYLGVTHGANGILYWEYNDAKRSPAVWEAVVALSNELKALTPALTAPTVQPGARADSSDVHLITKDAADGLYVIAVNAAPEPVGRVTITIPRHLDAPAEVLFEGRRIKLADGKITDEFRGYERHVYRIGK
ncbi:MAG: beta-galactosidase, partial [Armatimonadota bacterium]